LKQFFKTVRNIIKSIVDNDLFGMASEMGYMLVIGFFPFILFLTGVFSWLGKHAFMTPIFRFMEQVMPSDIIRLLQTVLNEVWFFSKGGFFAILGFCITLFLSTNAIAIVAKGLNRAYKIPETRSFIYARALGLVMVFVNALVLFLSINLIIFGKIIIEFLIMYLGLGEHLGKIMLLLRWPIAFVALFIMAYLQYYVLPDLKTKESLRRKSAFPGAFFFTISWLIGSWGFSIYINNLHTYNFVYGTIGAFAVLMVWLYYTSILILVGGEINSQLYYKLQRLDDIKTIREENEQSN